MDDPIKAEFESLLSGLPLLANVAFTARAVRRVEPLFVEPDPEQPSDGAAVIRRAIETAERIAKGETISFETASATAREVAGISRSLADAPALVARAASGAAGTGAIAMGGNPEAATHAFRAASNCARDVLKAAGDDACRAALLADIRTLADLGNRDLPAIPASFFDRELWPEGAPEWFNSQPQ